jgi:hypothetical protein
VRSASALTAADSTNPPSNADLDPLWFDDDHASTEFRQRVCPHEPFDQVQDSVGMLRFRSKHHDAGVAARWVVPQVADSSVEREQHPTLFGRGCDDHRVAPTTKLLLDHRVHIVATVAEQRSQVVRQVLVEPELHAGSGWIASRASTAP